MSGEKLERVVHENQLRPGLLVEGRCCSHCGETHRVMLLRKQDEFTRCFACELLEVWATAPRMHRGLPGPCWCKAIAEGRLYIVNPFDEQQTTTTKQRERSHAR